MTRDIAMVTVQVSAGLVEGRCMELIGCRGSIENAQPRDRRGTGQESARSDDDLPA